MKRVLSCRLRGAALPAALTLATLARGGEAQSRPDVAGLTAAVVSDHPLASAAGAEVLRRGGNAVDAAITMAGVLAVVRPHMNGVGGDAFLLIREAATGKVQALNGSGAAGSRAVPAFFRARSLAAVPEQGPLSVSVPGAVRAWADALERLGTISLADALAPAIGYAERGFPVSTRLAADIGEELKRVAADPELARTFLVDGRPPTPGTLLVQPDLARTLRALATGGPAALYGGDIGRRLALFLEREGGLVTADDLARHRSTWQEPIATTYHGLTVLAFPPNTQGLTLLQQLNLAELLDVASHGHNTAEYIHALVEAKRLAFADRDRHVADPAFARVPVERLISKGYARELLPRVRANRRGADTAAVGKSPLDGSGDTVFLCVVDERGNAVSMIQSLFHSFGSGRMVPGTGIVLHNRGALFSLDPAHANVIAPRKRPYHTLSPHMVLRADGSLYMAIGTPGGDGQTQTIAQVLNNILLFGHTPQQAVEAPRWRSFEDGRLGVEPGIADSVRLSLERLGHRVALMRPGSAFGGAQVILVQPASGAKVTGADPRREAYAIAW